MARRRLLEGVSYVYNWTTIVGALEGVLRYLGHDYSTPYLMGVSGHAFRLDVSGRVEAADASQGLIGPDGPTSIDYGRALAAYSRLGRGIEAISASRGDKGYERVRDKALAEMRRSIDRGLPAIAFDLHLPEFGIVKGYDDRERLLLVDTVLTPQTGEMLPYDRWPSNQGIGWVMAILPGRKAQAADLATAEREALRFALAHAEKGEGGPGGASTHHGFAAYGYWAATLEGEAKVSGFGNAYTGQVLQAARRHAGQFLRELAAKHPQAAPPLAEAATAYERAALVITRFTTLFPFPQGGEVDNAAARRLGASCLREALAEEERAIAGLRTAQGRL
ncbi:MAG: hypothetical protein ACE5KW_03285 [Dehalococcoidia bacterium]